ncbi:hypothetical protein [Knoellia sp. LjRoot47]|uniref:hypothetical protein n=1 Tax=Knoellia sp. LjRoot47 TaxID=3342330 RepID=UPI003ED0F9BB
MAAVSVTVVNEQPHTVTVKDSSTAAVKAARDELLASKGAGTGAARKRMLFPPGVFDIRENDALLTPSDGNNDGFFGVEIVGSGRETTTLRFTPSSTGSDPRVGNLMSANKRLRMARVADMTVESAHPDASFLYAYHDGGGANQNQGCTFERLNFRGNWKRVFGFDGGSTANLNSEMSFAHISGQTATYSDAFLKVGGISGTYNQQNQFLDYWMRDCFFILAGGTLIDFVKGGNLHVRNGSWSASSSAAPAMRFIHLGLNYNNLGAAQFSFEGVRFEPKAANHRVLDCELGHGTVGFRHCTDQSSIQNTTSYDYPLTRVVGQSPWGFPMHPTLTYEQCHLAGYVSYEGGPATRGRIRVLGSHLYRGNNHALANPTQDQGGQGFLRWPGGAPRYHVEDCNTAERVYAN